MELWTVVHKFEPYDECSLLYSASNFSTYEEAYKFMKKAFEQKKERYVNKFNKDEGFQIDHTISDMCAKVCVKSIEDNGYYVLDTFEILKYNSDDDMIED